MPIHIGIIGNGRKVRIVRFARHVLQNFTPDGYIPLFRTVRADEHIDDGALAAAAFADDCRHALFGEGHIHIFKHITLTVIGEGHAVQF